MCRASRFKLGQVWELLTQNSPFEKKWTAERLAQDSYDFCGSFVGVFARLGDALQERVGVGELPREPDPQMRLVQLSRVLQASGVALADAATKINEPTSKLDIGNAYKNLKAD